MLTPLQRKTAESLVNVFETGSVIGDYGNVTLIPGDTGGLTYGRSQTTRASGNLAILMSQYCAASGARFAGELRPYLPRLQKRDSALDGNANLKALLRQAGTEDPVMRSVQDTFFDAVYWSPAAKIAEQLGIETALGMAVIYDSTVHGSLKRMAERTRNLMGPVAKAGEKNWIIAYLKVRRLWLLSCAAPLPVTVYRMDELLALTKAGNWELDLPITCRGEVVSLQAMGIVAGPAPGWTLLLNDSVIGQTWQNPDDSFRNYIPARQLLEALFGKETDTALSLDGKTLEWNEQTIPAPVVVREGVAWGQVRALAGWLGLTVDKDDTAKCITVRRHSPQKGENTL